MMGERRVMQEALFYGGSVWSGTHPRGSLCFARLTGFRSNLSDALRGRIWRHSYYSEVWAAFWVIRSWS